MTASIGCGEAIVRSLLAHGTEVVFGIPGTHNLPIYDCIPGSGLRHITPRHEQGAGYAADGYARVSGKPGVCLVTTGPGLTNIATAAATAYHDSVPLLIISPGMPGSIEGRDTGYLHETKNQSGAMDNLVAWSRRVGSADETVEAIRDAFQHFANERPRPVHIEIPLDILADGRLTAPAPVYQTEPAARPGAEQVRAAADLLRQAQRPGMILGGGATGAVSEAREMVERLGAIVVTTCNGKGTVPESHPLSLGATIRFAAAQRALAGCDVVLAVGTEIGEADTWVPCLDMGGDVIRVDIDEAQLQKNLPSTAPVTGHAATVLRALLDEIGDGPASGAGEERAERAREGIRAEHEAAGAPFDRMHAILNETLTPDAIIAGDSSQVSYFGTAYLSRAEQPRQFLYPAGYATLGYGIPAAIGGKIAAPERQVIAVLGDGAAMFSIAEIASAAELGVSLPIVIVENGGYAQIREGMLARGARPVGVDLPTPDFAGLGKAMGGEGVRLESLDELDDVLQRAVAYEGPTVIAVPFPATVMK
ncbi:MAG TPA: 5-guanidino-2-oxopentanoate decarboxylase [Chloroflexota bacterium]|nr:5-guanidino-2-oxopentanoate decarboxylase [Chloroflexota bacterium]